MKKLLYVLGGLLGVFLLAAILVPVLFKGKILAVVDRQIAKNINANVRYDVGKSGLSLIKNFPNISLTVGALEITGKDTFEADTLIRLDEFVVSVNMFSLLGKATVIKRVLLKNADIHVKVMENGLANYDIFVETDGADTVGTPESDGFAVKVDKWVLSNANIRYDDRSLPAFMDIRGFDHEGRGDFTLGDFDLVTKNTIQSVTAVADGVTYLNKNSIRSDMALNINLPENTYTFRDNFLTVNDFTLSFEGMVKLLEAGYGMDLRFSSPEGNFKNLLSLVPAVFLEGTEGMVADGKLAFNGMAKGTYDAEKQQYPAFNILLKVDDGSIQYPGLPKAVRNINMDMSVENLEGIIDNTIIDIRQFDLDLGGNPVSGKLRVQGLKEYVMRADINAKINLADLAGLIPMKGLDMRGLYTLAVKADGTYSQENNTVPKFEALMRLDNGFVKTADYPVPIENLTMDFDARNTDGILDNTVIDVRQFSLIIGKNPVAGKVRVAGLTNYNIDADIDAVINLEDVSKFYPLDKNMVIKGLYTLNVKANGLYSEKRGLVPKFVAIMHLDNGYVKTADYPVPVENLTMDFDARNTDGILDNTVVDVRKFSLNIGQNPVKGKVRVAGLTNYNIDADIDAVLNLEDVFKLYPLDSLEIKGLYTLNIKANGLYSEKRNLIPKFNALMRLENGYARSLAYPLPAENMTLNMTATNTTGRFDDSKLTISDAVLTVDNEPFRISGTVENLADYTYDLKVNGALDLALVDKLYPLKDMSLTGKIKADLQTKGKMSDIDAGRFGNLPTSGRMEVSNLAFSSTDLPQGLRIDEGVMSFTPKDMVLEKYEGFLGKSQTRLTGRLSNYMPFLFSENAVLSGEMTLVSGFFDVNEWMAAETPNTPQEETPGVVEVPRNVDFAFTADIAKARYTNLDLTNIKGKVYVKDGTVRMESLTFNTLGGEFVTNGAYSTADIAKPAFDFALKINGLGFQKAYEAFNTIQVFAPLAQHVAGSFSTDFALKGLVGKDMMPVYQSLTGGGMLSVTEAAIRGVAVLTKISELTNIRELNNPTMRNLALKTSFVDGKMNIDPFDFTLAGYKARIEGSAAFTGAMDYQLMVELPVDKLGSSLAAQLQGFTGSETVPLHFNVKGAYNSPNVSLDQQKFGELVRAAAQQRIRQEASGLLDQLMGGQKRPADSTATRQADSTQTKQDSTAQKPKQPAQQNPQGQLKDAVKDVLNPDKKKN